VTIRQISLCGQRRALRGGTWQEANPKSDLDQIRTSGTCEARALAEQRALVSAAFARLSPELWQDIEIPYSSGSVGFRNWRGSDEEHLRLKILTCMLPEI